MEYLTSPGIPVTKVNAVVMSARFSEINKALSSLGIDIIGTDCIDSLPYCVSDHADMIFRHLGGRRCLTASGCDGFAQQLIKCGFVVEDTVSLNSIYPNDCILNILELKNDIFCSKASADYIKRFTDKTVHIVKQGYASCSTAVVNESSIITADKRIALSCSECGYDVLMIEQNDIVLKGYSNGFIGGCCGLLSPCNMAVTGSLDKLKDGEKIRNYCNSKGVSVIELTDNIPVDIGGIVPVIQK